MATYKQAASPNLDPVIYQEGKALQDWRGWCFSYVAAAFKITKWIASSAWEAWGKSKSRHTGKNLPAGVYVPIWFDGYWNGKRVGHVAIYKDGKIWSSPAYAAKPYADTWKSIAEVERVYGMKYVGWSEYIGDVRVIAPVTQSNSNSNAKGEDMIKATDKAQLRAVMRDIKGWNATNVDAGKYDKTEAVAWVGKTWEAYIAEAIKDGADYRKKRETALSYYAKKAANDKALADANEAVLTERGKASAAQTAANIANDKLKALQESAGASGNNANDEYIKDTNENVNWLVGFLKRIFKG